MKYAYKPDFVIGDTIVEMKSRVESVSAMRNAFLQLAVYVSQTDKRVEGVLVLQDPGIAEQRVQQEWKGILPVLRPAVAERLHIVVAHGGARTWASSLPNASVLARLDQRLATSGRESGLRLPRWSAIDEVLKFVVLQWYRNAHPLTAVEIMKNVGCSYPTVADAMLLMGELKPRSDRKIEPADAPLFALMNVERSAPKHRSTIRFADRSGQPRTASSLLKRLRELNRLDIAVGGTFAARHYNKKLDLIGDPRLDVIMHCHGSHADIEFVSQLDPALQETTSPREPARLAIHFLRRKVPLFVVDPDGNQWADQMECMLDLRDMGLESHANDMLFFFEEARRRAQ